MRSPDTVMQDIDIVAQRLRDELTAEPIGPETVETYLAQLSPDGSWPDTDYDDRARTHWSPEPHPVRVAQMAAAYRQSLFAPDEGDRLEAAILGALAFWVDRDPQSDNWWHNCIHTPTYVGRILLLMGDTIPEPAWDKAVAIVRRSGFERTGANLTWEAGNLLVLARATNRGAEFSPICRRMAIVDPDHAGEYADFAARVTGEQAPGSSGPRGNRHYWRSDVMVHRPGHFYASVRMHSTRTLATETFVNRENLKGYHLSDGVCFLMQRGDEYHDVQLVWDWRKLPGATCRETRDPLPYGRELARPGNTAFVGGVPDGKVGVAAMDYDRDGVQARKAWFFLPDGWVALGAGIGGATGDPITTSVNQCLLRSDVLLLRGAQVAPLVDPQWRGDNLEGIHHDGVGYYLLEPQRAVVRAAPQSGTWTSIEERSTDTRVVTQDVFGLWIEHGKRCSDSIYAYRVVPGLPAGDLAAYTSTSPVAVLANDARLQAVVYSQAELFQAVFYAAGRLTVGDGLTVETDAPCVLMLAQAQDAATLSVADPTQSIDCARVQLSGHYTGTGCVYDPAQGVTVVTVDLPADAFAGQTVQVSLRAGQVERIALWNANERSGCWGLAS